MFCRFPVAQTRSCKRLDYLSKSRMFHYFPVANISTIFSAYDHVGNSSFYFFTLLLFQTLFSNMTENPRRLISVPNPTKGDRWRYQTVQGHVVHPPRQAQKHVPVTHPPRQVDGLHRFENWTVQGHVAHPPKQAQSHVAVTHPQSQVDSLHRFDNWTVQDHVAITPPPTQQYQSQIIHGHISAPV